MTDTTPDFPLSHSPRFISALTLATSIHTETRKEPSIPYISHLYSVAALVMEANGSENEVIAALLYDAVEDHGGLKMLKKIRLDFGEAVANIVAGCSDDIPPDGQEKRPWRYGKGRLVSTESCGRPAPRGTRCQMGRNHPCRSEIRSVPDGS